MDCNPSLGGERQYYISSPERNFAPVKNDYIMDHHKPTIKYSLGSINFALFSRGKVYSLLGPMEIRRRLRCGCVKSNCMAKYCECYRSGQTCGDGCGCIDCHNNRKHRKLTSLNSHQVPLGCNCVKSGCLKKYCECFQRGEKCGAACHCSDCRNCEDPGSVVESEE